MGATEAELIELLGGLYDAALDATRWPQVLGAIARRVGGIEGHISSLDHANPGRSGATATSGADPAYLALYERYYASINPWATANPQFLRSGNVFVTDRIIPPHELVRTEFYADFLRPQDYMHALVAMIAVENRLSSNLVVIRPASAGPYGESDLALFGALMPHLQRVVQIHHRLYGMELRALALADALDRLPQGALILDRKGRLLHQNRAAKTAVGRADGLSLGRDGQLRAARSDETVALCRLIAECRQTSAGEGMDPGGAMKLTRSGDRRPYTVIVSPFHGVGGALGNRAPAVLVLLSDPDAERAARPQRLRALYGLTPAEARMANLLLAGRTVKEAAGVLGVTDATARSHLKALLAKTETRRQSDLIRVLLLESASLRENRAR